MVIGAYFPPEPFAAIIKWSPRPPEKMNRVLIKETEISAMCTYYLDFLHREVGLEE